MGVNRLTVLSLGIVLLSCPKYLLAQHGGHGGGRRGAPGAGSTGTSDSSLTDFNRALAVQATPDQASHFQEWAKGTETARKLVQDLVRQSGASDSTKKSTALKDSVEEAQGGSQDFLKSFSKSQKSGLKELAKKLEKAESEVGKQWKILKKQLTEAKADSNGIAGTADLLEKALGEFQSQQMSLGQEMGIQKPAM
jgi:hypothetical protein